MNSIELKQKLLEMMSEAIKNNKCAFENPHPCFLVGVIDCIMRRYMEVADYYEENAIATFKGFLKSGVLSW